MPYTPESIVSYFPGSYTPGAESTLKLNVDIVNAAWNKAMEQLYNFNAKVDALTNETTGWLALNKASPITSGDISVTAPTAASMTVGDVSTATVFNDFTTQANTVITALATKFSTYLSAWFPDETTTYAAAEAYLLDAISNTTSGAIPAAIKSAIIESGRVEIVASATRATEEATTRYAAMRHPLPPGALAGATLRIAQGSLDSEAALIRSIAQKDFELAYQRGMDAVQKALANRQTALSAAKEYIASLVGSGYEEGAKITGAAYSARTTMIGAAGDWLKSQVAASDLTLRSLTADKGLEMDASKANQQAELANIEFNLKTFLSQTQALAAMITALTNNVRAGGNTSYTVSGT